MENEKAGTASVVDSRKPLDPATLSFIERISWFEHQQPLEADNDNSTSANDRERGSACFDSWALPEFMRK